jgi:iron only hydrogenase large subunit-like protein
MKRKKEENYLAVMKAIYAVAKRKRETIPASMIFFRLSFCDCLSCVNNCQVTRFNGSYKNTNQITSNWTFVQHN